MPRAATHLSDPTAVRRAGRPARLSRERIVAAAVAGNLDTLTMRELATRLGVSHGALYRWVDGRDAVLDLVSDVIVERILPHDAPRKATWRPWLRRLAWATHDEFLAVPGYATRTARPHRHNDASYQRLRSATIAAFVVGGASRPMAEQSCDIFGLSVVGWLAAHEAGSAAVPAQAADRQFALFVDVLVRGLPAREPVTGRP